MKILIYGFGSIGKRHANNFSRFGQVYICDIKNLNFYSSKYKILKNTNNIYKNFFDLTIICTPTINHIRDCFSLQTISKFLLIEKPISNNYKKLSLLSNQIKKKIIVCCNMRFHQGIKSIRENIKLCGNIYYVQNYFRHSLKNMNRTSNNYIYKEKKSTSILYDCIHELDYLNFLFSIKKISIIQSHKLSDNKISKDHIQVLSKFDQNIHGSTYINYIDQFKFRGLEIIGEKGTLVWRSEGKQKERVSVNFYKKDKIIKLFKTNNYNSNLPYKEMALEVYRYLIDKNFKIRNNKLSFFNDASHLIKLINNEQ